MANFNKNTSDYKTLKRTFSAAPGTVPAGKKPATLSVIKNAPPTEPARMFKELNLLPVPLPKKIVNGRGKSITYDIYPGKSFAPEYINVEDIDFSTPPLSPKRLDFEKTDDATREARINLSLKEDEEIISATQIFKKFEEKNIPDDPLKKALQRIEELEKITRFQGEEIEALKKQGANFLKLFNIIDKTLNK